jgi:hypothetical protein
MQKLTIISKTIFASCISVVGKYFVIGCTGFMIPRYHPVPMIKCCEVSDVFSVHNYSDISLL